MAVNATHPDYHAAALDWSRARDVLAGEDITPFRVMMRTLDREDYKVIELSPTHYAPSRPTVSGQELESADAMPALEPTDVISTCATLADEATESTGDGLSEWSC